MSQLLSRTSMLAAGLMALSAGAASGQDYPSRPVRIITGTAGASLDFASRLIAQGIAGPLHQNVIVDNRGTLTSIELVAKAPPDGYTLVYQSTALWVVPLFQKSSYDPVRDFAPVSMTNRIANAVVVHPSLKVKTVKELIALAKARPGELNYASGASGSSIHLAGELFKSMAGINMVRIPYNGSGPGYIGILAGEVQLIFSSIVSAIPHTKAGKLVALAVTSAEPSALLPGLPTVAAAGLPGYESAAIYGIFAPAKTPAAIINRLNQEIVRYLNTPEAKERFLTSGAEVVGSTPAEFSAQFKAEMVRVSKLIKDTGIKME